MPEKRGWEREREVNCVDGRPVRGKKEIPGIVLAKLIRDSSTLWCVAAPHAATNGHWYNFDTR